MFWATGNCSLMFHVSLLKWTPLEVFGADLHPHLGPVDGYQCIDTSITIGHSEVIKCAFGGVLRLPSASNNLETCETLSWECADCNGTDVVDVCFVLLFYVGGGRLTNQRFTFFRLLHVSTNHVTGIGDPLAGVTWNEFLLESARPAKP